MSELLIFGGTTEGRELSEYCVRNGICTDVSVATDYGASLLPNGVNVLCGRLDADLMTSMLLKNRYKLVIDATHPYAVEATLNIKKSCDKAGVQLLRLIRKSSSSCGRTVRSMNELVQVLNNSQSTVLSTLGSKSLFELSKVKDYRERLWIRVLPSEEVLAKCHELGYDPDKIILEKGPFTVDQNILHLQKSRSSILVTKESGDTGGYSEKAEAARILGIEMITLARPVEQGYFYEEIIEFIRRELNK